MSIDQLKKLCDQLESARKLLAEQEARLSACTLGHQQQITVNIEGLGAVALTEFDHRYMSRLIRGREMIMLGVKKALAAMVEAQAERVANLERAISEAQVTV